jgi:pimeloyl-ACP methyl ester carboxylesterase
MIPRLCIFFLSLTSLFLAGCSCKPLQHYSLDTPPLTLTPISLTNSEDGRGRFREIYCDVQRDHGATLPHDRLCEEVIVRLQNEPEATGKPVWLGQARLKLRILVVSGIYSECINHITNAYSYALKNLERYGYRTGDLRVSGRSSSTYNATQIRDALMTIDLLPDEKVVLVGYSKGAPDILEAVAAYPDILPKLAAVVSVAGAIGGSPLAGMISQPYEQLLTRLSVSQCLPGVGDPLESLKPSTRRVWLSRNTLPKSVKYFSLSTFAGKDDISEFLRPTYDRLALIDPRNDSQLIYYDQIIPGATLLGYVKADHWAVAMPFSEDIPLLSSVLLDKNKFPREVLLEAVIRFVEEKLLPAQ